MILRKLFLLLLFSGIALLSYALYIGEASMALFIVFPVIYGTGAYSTLGILLIMAGIFLLFLSPLENAGDAQLIEPNKTPQMYDEPRESKEERVKYGGVVFIGPIPIVFGSDRGMARLSLLIGVVMLIAIAVFYFLYIYG